MFLNFLLILIQIFPESNIKDHREKLKDEFKNISKKECLELIIYYSLGNKKQMLKFIVIATIFNSILIIPILLINFIFELNIIVLSLFLFGLLMSMEIINLYITNVIYHNKIKKIINIKNQRTVHSY